MSVLDYMVKYENFIVPKCFSCEKDAKVRNWPLFYDTCCDKMCITIQRKVKKLTEQHKEKIRKSRVLFLSKEENRKKTAWFKKANSIMTYGENFLHELFEKNEIYKKYDVVREYSHYPYFIDFAFVNEKVAIEFDGSCHFSNGLERVEHDIARDEALNNAGWRVFRVAYYELEEFKIETLTSFIGDPDQKKLKCQLEKYEEIIKRKNKVLTDKAFLKRAEKKEKCENITIKLLSSNIDFSKFGWVNLAASVIGCKSQKVSKWMKKHLSDFYQEKCFKRKTNIMVG